MGMQCGIVGLPNVGKSTLFNALTGAGAQAANYPFCTIEPNVGLVTVPDPRLTALVQQVNPQKVLPAVVNFVDIAGLIEGASKGEGLGNQFLTHIREVDAIVQVVRCYEDENVTHVSGTLDPASDIATIQTELALADLDVVEKALAKLEKKRKTGQEKVQAAQDILSRVQAHLAQGQAIRHMDLTEEEQAHIKAYQFLTAKPILYVANVGEEDVGKKEIAQHQHVKAVMDIAHAEQARVVVLCAALEEEVSALSDEEKKHFLEEFGLESPGLDQLIQAGYHLLGLQTFFTAGPKEVRAWTVPVGALAPQAAGVIHSDFEKTFIRAEIIKFQDYIDHNGEQGAKSAGVWQLEGKEYVVQDGDVIFFRVG